MPSRFLVPLLSCSLTGTAFAGHASNELNADVEVNSIAESGYGLSLAYAHRVQPAVLVGAGVGFGYSEERHTFETPQGFKANIFYALHGDGFARFEPFEFLHFDTGVTAMRYAIGDDGAPSGTFLGLYASASVGYAPIFVSTRIRAGHASGDSDEYGAIYTPVTVRAVFDW
jgi:hypothetical protein